MGTFHAKIVALAAVALCSGIITGAGAQLDIVADVSQLAVTIASLSFEKLPA
jgi:hypothetical protein